MKLFKQPLALKQKPLTPLLLTFKIVQLHEDSLTTNGREWTRRNVSDSRPLVSIRGSFFVPSGWAMPRRDFFSAYIQDRINSREFSNHEWKRMDTKKWPDSRSLMSIRGSFFVFSGLVCASP